MGSYDLAQKRSALDSPRYRYVAQAAPFGYVKAKGMGEFTASFCELKSSWRYSGQICQPPRSVIAMSMGNATQIAKRTFKGHWIDPEE